MRTIKQKPKDPTSVRQLTPDQQRLIAICRKTGFGEVRNIRTLNGQPKCDGVRIEKRDRLTASARKKPALTTPVGCLSETEALLMEKLAAFPDATEVSIVLRDGEPLDVISESEIVDLSL